MPGPRASRRGYRRRDAGFSLAEALVALAVLAVAILFTLAMTTREPLLRRRLDARRATLDALEDRLEAVRAGASLGVPPEASGDVLLSAEARPEGPPGLCRLSLHARHAGVVPPVEARVETLVYRPGEDCR